MSVTASLPRAIAAVAAFVAGASTVGAEPMTGALGLALGWERRADYATDARLQFVPELVGQLGIPFRDRMTLRPGARIGYVGLQQAEMPQSLRITERDLAVAVEAGLAYEVARYAKVVVVPVWSIGMGMRRRSIAYDVAAPIDGSNGPDDRGDWLATLHAQVGIGVKLWREQLAIEPHVRYEHVFRDDRIGWQYGLLATYKLW
ncbi:MAG: hypothetical protein AB7P03_00670 [Kofleriaceae bacterium]